jgi:hypothetical protein
MAQVKQDFVNGAIKNGVNKKLAERNIPVNSKFLLIMALINHMLLLTLYWHFILHI